MNIKGQGHSLTFTFPNVFSLETSRPIETKFHMESPLDRGMKICSTGLCHMTNMATMPIYGKKLKKIFFSGTKRPMTLKVGMQKSGTRVLPSLFK